MFDFILLFHWTQLLQPQWYIDNGGLWFIVFAVFAETGLFAGFFYQETHCCLLQASLAITSLRQPLELNYKVHFLI